MCPATRLSVPRRRGPRSSCGRACALAPGEERYTVPGGGAIAVPIHAGDRVRVVDVEGMQRCELVAADDAGNVDPAILGAQRRRRCARPEANSERRTAKARAPSAPGSSGAASILPRARAVTLFGGESRPGDAAEFTVSRDGLLIVAAPGAHDGGRRAGHGDADPRAYHAQPRCAAERNAAARAARRSAAGYPRQPGDGRGLFRARRRISSRSSTSPAANAPISSASPRASSTRDWSIRSTSPRRAR